MQRLSIGTITWNWHGCVGPGNPRVAAGVGGDVWHKEKTQKK